MAASIGVVMNDVVTVIGAVAAVVAVVVVIKKRS